MTSFKYLIFFALIGIMACQEDENIVEEVVQDIDPILQPYLDRFEEEGNERGAVLGLETLTLRMQFEEMEEDEVAGQCGYSTNGPARVSIDPDFWAAFSDLEREYLVFHELGHCILKRSHLDDAGANGSCVSIMQSGTGNCRMNYTRLNRATYLDELFD